MNKPRERFHFNPPTQVDGSSMIGLISQEMYNSIFNMTEEHNKFELYTDTFDEFSFSELKHEVKEILDVSNTSHQRLQDGEIGLRIISTCRNLEIEKRVTDDCNIVILGYARSLFRDFENYPRIVVGLDELDNQLILKHYNSNIVTDEFVPGIYTIEDLQKPGYPHGDHE